MKSILVFSNGEKIGDGLIKLPLLPELKKIIEMVPRGRIELPTQGFSVLCSTNWAIWAKCGSDCIQKYVLKEDAIH